ncbi:MAG: beta-ketoacyl synthase N-terminal-like domain-containing protein [Planctomycetota bacterium]|nr:beta-ketoacyl synthase N-terminal-like domain-containing protein [Planctomycetota bacterium]
MRTLGDDDVVITGVGCVTALGHDLASSHAAILTGRSAVTAQGDASPRSGMARAAVIAEPLLRSKVPEELEPQIKFLNGAGRLAADACAEAVAASNLLASPYPDARRGLYLAQMDSYDWSCPEFHNAFRAATEDLDADIDAQVLNRAAARHVKPFFMLESLKNNAFSFLATGYGLRGANTSVAGYAGPTWTCFDMAVRSVRSRRLDAAVVLGAARPTSGVARAELQAHGLTFAPGDGAAAFVLERRAEALARGALIRGVVVGSAGRTVAPRGGSLAPSTLALCSAAEAALAEAGAVAEDLAVVVVPGAGQSDLERTLDGLPATCGVGRSAYKDQLGHCGLAADAVEAALALASLEPGSGALVLSAGLLGQAGALVLLRP